MSELETLRAEYEAAARTAREKFDRLLEALKSQERQSRIAEAIEQLEKAIRDEMGCCPSYLTLCMDHREIVSGGFAPCRDDRFANDPVECVTRKRLGR